MTGRHFAFFDTTVNVRCATLTLVYIVISLKLSQTSLLLFFSPSFFPLSWIKSYDKNFFSHVHVSFHFSPLCLLPTRYYLSNATLFLCIIIIIFMAQQPLVGQSLLVIEASHSDAPHSIELLWTSDRPVAETST